MIQCPDCGIDLEIDTAKFCTNCGTKLIQKQVPPSPLAQRRVLGRPSPSYRPWLIITGSIVTIGIIVFSVILVGSYFLSSLFGPSLGSGIVILSDNDFLEYSSSGTGTQQDPYILSNYYLTDQFIGFSIEDTTKHFIIANCTIDMCYEAIHIENIAPGTGKIDNNTIYHSNCRVWETGPRAGITIHSSIRVNVSNNIIFDAGSEGILIESSRECFVFNNTISNQYVGIFLEDSDSSIITNNSLEACDDSIYNINSNYVNISYNRCINNYESFINIISSNFVKITNNFCFNTTHWYYWSAGITLDECKNCSVLNNTITNCYKGVHVPNTSYCQIKYNLIENNSEFGVGIAGGWIEAEFNLICLNTFISNNLNGISQASDNGTSNYWYHTDLKQGNYWSDWNGTSPYTITGTANATDIFPLSEPPV